MNRWWSPERSFDEPDDVVKSAFIATGDDDDLSTTLLGVHRAVAGAIEHRVASGVIDEIGLVDAMAGMRELVAEDAVGAVSKSMEPTYSGLLVRDWCDTGEVGALELFRAAVSKGVPPPVAAKRAAAVYGVPYAQMGGYIAKALDPKTPPPVLDDAADRALMKHVMSIVESEAPQPVAKSLPPAEREEFNRRVRRDAEGQFARSAQPRDARSRVMDRFGVINIPSSLEIPDTLVATPEEQKAAPPQRELRPTQRKRSLNERPQRSLSAPKQKQRVLSTPSQKAPARQLEQKELSSRQMSQKQLSSKKMVRELNAKMKQATPQVIPKPANVMDAKPQGIDLLAPVNNGGREYGRVGEEVTFYASGAEWNELSQIMRIAAGERGDNETVARLGHLVSNVDGGHLREQSEDMSRDRDDSANFDIEETRRRNKISGDPSITVDAVTDMQIARHGGMDGYVNHVIADSRFARGLSDAPTTSTAYEPYAPYGEVYEGEARAHVVHHRWEGSQAYDQYGMQFQAPLPKVVEMIVMDAAGEVIGTGSRGYTELDPNQAYRVSHSEDGSSSIYDENLFWDDDNKVVVQRVFLHPVDEDELRDRFGKGDLTGAELAEFNRRVKRDRLGQFTATADRGQQVELPGIISRLGYQPDKQDEPANKERRTLSSSPKQKRRALSSPGQRRTLSETSRQMSGRQLAGRTMSRQMTPAAGKPKQMTRQLAPANPVSGARPELVLEEHSDYRVFNQESWAELTELFDQEDMDALHDGTDLKLSHMERRSLAEARPVDISGVVTRLQFGVDVELTKMGVHEPDAHKTLPSGASHDEVLIEVQSIFEQMPHVSRIDVVRRRAGIELAWSMQEIPNQVIVDIPHGFDPDRKYKLHYVGTYQARDLYGDAHDDAVSLGGMMETMQGGEGSFPNPNVDVYRINAPIARRYRAEES